MLPLQVALKIKTYPMGTGVQLTACRAVSRDTVRKNPLLLLSGAIPEPARGHDQQPAAPLFSFPRLNEVVGQLYSIYYSEILYTSTCPIGRI